jgi:hypothetical protein
MSPKLFSRFLRCLRTLPNVHTLQIIACSTTLPSLFTGYTFTHVRKVTVPLHAFAILKSFPGVREINCIASQGTVWEEEWIDLIEAVEQVCKKLEDLHGIIILDERMMKREEQTTSYSKRSPNIFVACRPRQCSSKSSSDQISPLDHPCNSSLSRSSPKSTYH